MAALGEYGASDMSADDAVFVPPPPVTDAPPAVEAPVVEEPVKPAEEPAKGEPKPGSFAALKVQKDKEREDALSSLRAEYEAKLAEVSGKVVDVDGINKNWQEKLTAAESLKIAHETKLTELEQKIVADYETPYNIGIDPEAQSMIASMNRAKNSLDAAVNQAATSLGEDQRSVTIISQHKTLFAKTMAAMMEGLLPDSVHAQNLASGLVAAGVTVAMEDARAVIRDLKNSLPKLLEYVDATESLKAIKAHNEPAWGMQQAARHEAYRQQLRGAADVADDATEGDEGTMAGILRSRPELRDQLKSESDKLSAMVVGPAPGRATASSIRATPSMLHSTAIKAARLPVALEAYRETSAKLTAAQARIGELEARLGEENGSVPRPAGGSTEGTGKGFSFEAEMAKIAPRS